MKLKHITKANIKCFNCNKILDIKVNGIYNDFYKIIYKCICTNTWTLYASMDNSNTVLYSGLNLNNRSFFIYSKIETSYKYYSSETILINRESFMNLIKDFDIERIKEKYDKLILFK
jgi:hypothetical protein